MAWRTPDLHPVMGVDVLVRLVLAHPPVVVLAGEETPPAAAPAIRGLQDAGAVAHVVSTAGALPGVRDVVVSCPSTTRDDGAVARAELLARRAGILLVVGAGTEHPYARRAQRAVAVTPAELHRMACRLG